MEDKDPFQVLMKISSKKNLPGDLKEEVQKFLQFAEDKVYKHQVILEKFVSLDLIVGGIQTV